MRSTSLAFLSVIAAAVAQTLNVNSPPLTVCQPAAIVYGGGTAPYFLSVIPGGQTNAAALQSFPTTATATAGTYTWNVNIAAGTPVTLQLKDNTGAIAYSGILTIAANTDTSCVGVAASSAPAASSAAAASSAPAGSSAASSSPATSVAAGTSSAAAGTSSAVSRSSAATGTTASSAPAAASSKPASATSTGLSMFALLGAAVVAIAA